MAADIDAVADSVAGLISELRTGETSRQVWMSVITFNSDVRRLSSLTPIENITPPHLVADGGTHMGRALRQLNGWMNAEVVDPEIWLQPEVVVMTDGQADDHWQTPAQHLRERVGHIIGVAVGDAVNEDTLSFFSTHVARIRRGSPDSVAVAFKWMGAVFQTVCATGGTGEMPAPPTHIRVTRGQKPELAPDSLWRSAWSERKDSGDSPAPTPSVTPTSEEGDASDDDYKSLARRTDGFQRDSVAATTISDNGGAMIRHIFEDVIRDLNDVTVAPSSHPTASLSNSTGRAIFIWQVAADKTAQSQNLLLGTVRASLAQFLQLARVSREQRATAQSLLSTIDSHAARLASLGGDAPGPEDSATIGIALSALDIIQREETAVATAIANEEQDLAELLLAIRQN